MKSAAQKSKKNLRGSSFSKEYEKKLRRDKNHRRCFFVIVLILLLQWTWLFLLFRRQTFTMGFYLCLFSSLANLIAFLLKKCIFDRGFNRNNRALVIYWMCCLRISDPFDQDVEKIRRTRMRSTMKPNRGKSEVAYLELDKSEYTGNTGNKYINVKLDVVDEDFLNDSDMLSSQRSDSTITSIVK